MKKGAYLLKIIALTKLTSFTIKVANRIGRDADSVLHDLIVSWNLFINLKVQEQTMMGGLVKFQMEDDTFILSDCFDEKNFERFGIKVLGFFETIDRY